MILEHGGTGVLADELIVMSRRIRYYARPMRVVTRGDHTRDRREPHEVTLSPLHHHGSLEHHHIITSANASFSFMPF